MQIYKSVFCSNVYDVLGLRGIPCAKTLRATLEVMRGLASVIEVEIPFWMLMMNWCTFALLDDREGIEAELKGLNPNHESPNHEKVLEAFICLKLGKKQIEEAPLQMRAMADVADEDGTDPRLKKMMDSFPVRSALQEALLAESKELFRIAANCFKDAKAMNVRGFIGRIRGTKAYCCDSYDPSQMCRGCTDARAAEPFFKMFGLLPELEKIAKLLLAGAKNEPKKKTK